MKLQSIATMKTRSFTKIVNVVPMHDSNPTITSPKRQAVAGKNRTPKAPTKLKLLNVSLDGCEHQHHHVKADNGTIKKVIPSKKDKKHSINIKIDAEASTSIAPPLQSLKPVEVNKEDVSKVESIITILEKQQTKVGVVTQFSLAKAVRHVAFADGGRLVSLVAKVGAPQFYTPDAEELKVHTCTFRSLCRIIVGQQLAGSAVKAIWGKFVLTFGSGGIETISPKTVLAQDMDTMRSSAGLSNAKAKAIFDLAKHYEDGNLSDTILLDPQLSTEELTNKLLAVKGIGPWSANMYQMFSLKLPDVFPTGDLGVRNGVARAFRLKGCGKNGSLCQKKDVDKLTKAFAPYAPFRSVASWYMWKVMDTKDFIQTE
eukprot:m.10810 g.10810  ORF g.10810 m.10810 type:complete len:371 (-) comp8496_c0_seq1:100-1212(-)